MDELLPPSGAEAPLARSDDEQVVAIYGTTHPDWTQRVTREQFLAAHPDLASRLDERCVKPPGGVVDWLLGSALPNAVVLLIAVLLMGWDWKIEHIFSRVTPGADAARTIRVLPLAQSAPPPASAPFVRALNEALTTNPLNWHTVLERAEALRADAAAMAAVRAVPATQAWLHEVLATAHVHLGERAPHRTEHWDAVIALDREFGPPEMKRPFALAFSACVARFERAGGSRDLFIGQESGVPPEELLDAVAALRSRHPAELEKSTEQQRQLARVEGYTLLRKITPRKVRWISRAPFDENDPGNRETWTQLARAMEHWRKLEGDRPSADLDQLQRVFWQTIDRFCAWPTRWKDDFVTIGNYDYRRADARAALAEIEARRTR